MIAEKELKIKIDKIRENEYIIKDNMGITIGQFFVLELSKENKFSLLRVKFYKDDKKYVHEFKKALQIFIESLYQNKNIEKITIIASLYINIDIFAELGFNLEGIAGNSISTENGKEDEIILGLDYDNYKVGDCINVFRLKGENVELKVLTPEDAEDMLRYYTRNRKFLEPYEPVREEDFYTYEYQKRTLVEGYKQFINNTSIAFGIYKNRQLIGKIRISNIVLGSFKNAFIGYSIDEKEQGNGYMKEAVSLTLDYSFNDIELHRIEATTLIDNIKSQRVLKACGFEEVGISKKYLYINGKWQDHKIFYKVCD
ncbi:GNAT family N-acetyltransferase [Clostridium sp. DL1XJH146]